jgi:glyoxylase-like metal-dependent hydrolase (beta-lactamase superfamily II)
MTGPPPASWAVDATDAGAREIVGGLWRLRIPIAWPGVGHVNAYAIDQEDGGIVLVDCGSAGHPTCAEALDVALAQAGRRVEDVRALVITHAHSDHVGQAAAVLARSGAELWSHPADGHLFDVVREPARFEALRAARARREGVPEDRIAAYATVAEEVDGAPPVRDPDHALVAGVAIPSALGRWEVVETPGHAPSHVCLFQRARRLLIVGDLLCVAFTPWMDYGFSADPVGETLASLDGVANLGRVDVALPGHGRPLTDVPSVVAEHRAGFAARLDAVRRAVARRERPGYDLAVELHGDEPDAHAAGHLVEVVSLLAHLRARGEVVRDETGPTFTYRTATGAGGR